MNIEYILFYIFSFQLVINLAIFNLRLLNLFMLNINLIHFSFISITKNNNNSLVKRHAIIYQ